MDAEQFCDQAPERWCAIRVKSRCEQTVRAIACNKGFEVFLPVYQSRRRWSDRFKSVELPLFAGYVFCRLVPEHRLPILTIPGVLHFVGVGRIPIPIDDAEIAAIQTAIRSGLWTEPWPFLQVGQRVRLQYGPLADLEGILLETHKKNRIVVSIPLLKRSVAVEIQRDWVTPLDTTEQKMALQTGISLAEKAPYR